jgi:hypothetical protein
MSSIRKALLTVLLAVLLQACALQHEQVNSLAERLDISTPESTLLSLQAMTPPKRDRAQYLLNTGLLKSITGDFEGAISDLQSAKDILNTLQAISVSENLAAATINETLRSYDSSASERVLLHVLLSIDYLMLNDLDAARVEVLQADVVMNQLAREDMPTGQLASAHYIAGLVYELGGELDNARISYSKAANLMTLRNMSLPAPLRSSLLSPNWRLRMDGEKNGYREQYFVAIDPPDPDTAEIIVIYWDGVVTSKRGRTTSVWVPELRQTVSLALPYYPPSNYVEAPFTLSIAGRTYRTETIEDIETLLRDDMDDESAAIYAMTLARMVTKSKLVSNADNQNSSLALFTNLFAILSESADTRTWNMLPSSIQIARFSVPAGNYSLPYPLNAESDQTELAKSELTEPTESDQAELTESDRAELAEPHQAELAESKLTVSAGEKTVLFVPGVSERIFSYTQTAP